MEIKEIDESGKMELIKKLVNIFFIVSMVFGLAMFVLLICFNFAGVFTIQTLPGTKYENPFTYPGWQAIYYGVGEMIIQGYTDFTFNIFTFLGFILPFLAILVCSIIYLKNRKRRGTNQKKAILEFVMAGTILVGSFLLFFCDQLSIWNASHVTDSYQNYYEEYLLKALNGEVSFTKTAYPLVILLIGIVTCLVKTFNGLLLLYQKKVGNALKKG